MRKAISGKALASKVQQVNSQSQLMQPSIQHSQNLDLEYLSAREQICASPFYMQINRHTKIRINSWLQKLDCIITNPVWKKNRNHYVKLINLMCQCENIVEPFKSMPPKGDVPNLTKHEINRIIDQIQRIVKQQSVKKNEESFDHNRNEECYKPEQYWQKIKQLKGCSKMTYQQEQSSLFLGRFMDIARNSKTINQLDWRDSIVFSSECLKEQFKVNQYETSNDKQNVKQNNLINIILDEKQTIRNRTSNYRTPPKSLCGQLNVKTQSSSKQPPNYFAKNLRVKTSHVDNQKQLINLKLQFSNGQHSVGPQAYRDSHQSVQIDAQTLKTQILDHQGEQNSSFSQATAKTDDCNFEDELSQRCQRKDQIPVQNYFLWKCQQQKQNKKNNFQNVMRKPLKVIKIELISAKPIERQKDNRNETQIVQNQIVTVKPQIQNESVQKHQTIRLSQSCQIHDYHDIYNNIVLDQLCQNISSSRKQNTNNMQTLKDITCSINNIPIN